MNITMLDNILLGMKDIYKNKFIFLLIQVLILLICIIFVSTSLTMTYSQANTHSEYLKSQYSLVPISNDMSKNKEFVNRIYDEIHETSMTYFNSYSLSSMIDENVIILLGNGTMFSKDMPKSMDNTTVFHTQENLNQTDIELNGIYYPTSFLNIHSINDQSIAEHLSSSATIVYVNENNVAKWFDLMDGSTIIQMLENLNINSIDTKKIESLTNDSFIYMKNNNSSNSEVLFVLTYIYPYLLLTMIAIILAFTIFNRNSLRKMKKEYIIHMLCGARTSDIIIRNSVMMLTTLIIDCACISFLIKNLTEPIVNFVYLIIISLLLLFECMMMYQLKSYHIMNTIRND